MTSARIATNSNALFDKLKWTISQSQIVHSINSNGVFIKSNAPFHKVKKVRVDSRGSSALVGRRFGTGEQMILTALMANIH